MNVSVISNHPLKEKIMELQVFTQEVLNIFGNGTNFEDVSHQSGYQLIGLYVEDSHFRATVIVNGLSYELHIYQPGDTFTVWVGKDVWRGWVKDDRGQPAECYFRGLPNIETALRRLYCLLNDLALVRRQVAPDGTLLPAQWYPYPER